MKNFDPNGLFYDMVDFYHDNKTEDNVITICNEGGTRSSKTWDAFHLIYYFCDQYRDKGLEIYVMRETLVRNRNYTLKEWIKFAKHIGIFYGKTMDYLKSPAPTFTLFGNSIMFRGFDDDTSEGFTSDIVFINELLEVSKKQYDKATMRCKMLKISDWNPKYTDHWAFDLSRRPHTLFTRSTYKDNKHLERSVVSTIEGYNPFEVGSTYVEDNKLYHKGELVSDTNQPPPHIVNVDAGTASLFDYKVYNLGLRGAMTGLIFTNVSYIDAMPDGLAHIYGLDFGYTADPTALVRYAQKDNNIFVELLCYHSISSEVDMVAEFEHLGIERNVPIIADSADRYVSGDKGVQQMVVALINANYACYKVHKTNDVMFHLGAMRNYKIHIIKNKSGICRKTNKLYSNFAQTEAENYIMKTVNGIPINQPVDKFNHFWDATRYAFMSFNTDNSI